MSIDHFEVNRKTWNKKVKVHAKSAMYDLQSFKNGASSLKTYELEAMGHVHGKSILHLQCHFGQDTLSWSRMGADCVGVDLSDEGIALAKSLNSELGLNAQFVCCNVLDTSKHIKQQFDIVFTSYGVIGWLPDLKPWGQMIAERLKPGAMFFMVEFHPLVWMFDYTEGTAKLSYGYMQKEAIYEEYRGTYADQNSEMISKEYGWNHGFGEIISSLTEAGLHIDYLKEYDESPYNVLPDLVATENGMYKTKKQLYPLIFSLKATKV